MKAHEIDVTSGRVTVLWPLTLHHRTPPSDANLTDNIVDGFGGDLIDDFQHAAGNPERQARLWKPVEDPIEHIPRPQLAEGATEDQKRAHQAALVRWENESYAEAVYFHEFIQEFLFRVPNYEAPESSSNTTNRIPPFRLFRRTDIKKARVSFKDSTKEVGVERINLYLFRTGVAIFTMDLVVLETDELARKSGWSLAEFQDFHDQVRRAYAPYFDQMDAYPFKSFQGNLVVKKIAWLNENGDVLSGLNGETWEFDLNNETDHASIYAGRDGVRGKRYPPLFKHWRVLLSQLPLADYQKHRQPRSVKKGSKLPDSRWHHVVDERMPTLAAISLTGPENSKDRYNGIEEGDFVRLAFTDPSGTNKFPYDEGFLSGFKEKHAYDRFHSDGTRYLVSGYSFVAVGASWFFDNIVSMHMRRHYFQMALLAHLELASLLGFSGQISRAVAQHEKDNNDRDFENRMAAIEEEFLQFVHRFRFTGVSNQLQAQELFDLWRKHLRSDSLFIDVREELATANAYLQARADRRSSAAVEKLTVISAIGVLMTVIIGFLSSNFLLTTDIYKGILDAKVSLYAQAFWVSAVTTAVSALTGFLLYRYNAKTKNENLKIASIFSLFLGVIGLVVLIICLFADPYGFWK